MASSGLSLGVGESELGVELPSHSGALLVVGGELLGRAGSLLALDDVEGVTSEEVTEEESSGKVTVGDIQIQADVSLVRVESSELVIREESSVNITEEESSEELTREESSGEVAGGDIPEVLSGEGVTKTRVLVQLLTGTLSELYSLNLPSSESPRTPSLSPGLNW